MSDITTAHNANSLIEQQLDLHLAQLEKILDADVLMSVGGIRFGLDDIIRDAIESRKKRRKKLVVILETNGGYADVAERIANTFRKFYRRVEFIVPNYAMSAGTLLVMSGDAIHMDYYSVLGPIDPQVPGPNGDLIPVHGYLIQYDRLIEKSRDKTITTAELNFLIEKFDAAELYRYEQEMRLSVTLLKEWLVKYKFKNWSRTKTRRAKVTNKLRKERAEEIANKLNDTKRWHVHGRGIPMVVLRRALNLTIEDFEKSPKLNEELRCYQKLFGDYRVKMGHAGALNILGNYIPLR